MSGSDTESLDSDHSVHDSASEDEGPVPAAAVPDVGQRDVVVVVESPDAPNHDESDDDVIIVGSPDVAQQDTVALPAAEGGLDEDSAQNVDAPLQPDLQLSSTVSADCSMVDFRPSKKRKRPRSESEDEADDQQEVCRELHSMQSIVAFFEESFEHNPTPSEARCAKSQLDIRYPFQLSLAVIPASPCL